MILLMPTCDTHIAAAEASAGLLCKHWPDHPPLHVVHHDLAPRIPGATFHPAGPQSEVSWLEAVSRVVRALQGQVFILLLDDYALYAPPDVPALERAVSVVAGDPAVGMFALCPYPGHREGEVAAGVSRLRLPCAVLLQAAVWRRDWFLELATAVHPRCSPWGFEGAATQAAKKHPRAVYVASDPRAQILAYHNLMNRGQWADEHVGWLIKQGISVPSRGLGDTVAKALHVMGLDRLAPEGCGCDRRQEALNAAVPYRDG